METCEYRCDRGWLPIDGEVDAVIDDDDGTIVFTLVIPTLYRRCFCSESDLLPEGVAV